MGKRLQVVEAERGAVKEVKKISLKEAKKEIAAYFKENDDSVIDYGDLMEALQIPLPTIVKACEKLEKEGKIAGID